MRQGLRITLYTLAGCSGLVALLQLASTLAGNTGLLQGVGVVACCGMLAAECVRTARDLPPKKPAHLRAVRQSRGGSRAA